MLYWEYKMDDAPEHVKDHAVHFYANVNTVLCYTCPQRDGREQLFL